MTDSLQKYLAELLGTFTLVFVGTMGILAVRGEVSSANIAIAFAFGLALLAGLYAFADVSGAATSTPASRSRCSSTSGSTCRT